MTAWPPAHLPAFAQSRSRHDALVTALEQLGDYRRAQRVFHHHAASADVADARRVNRLLQVHAAIDQVDEHLRVGLRLDVSTHHAVEQQQPVVARTPSPE